MLVNVRVDIVVISAGNVRMRVHNRTSRRWCPLSIINSIFATDGKIELLSAATGTMLGGMGEVHGLW